MTDEPHRPPKYVDGAYKPHYGAPSADYAVLIHATDPFREPFLATTDDDGDAKGVVRYPPWHDHYAGKPIYSGAPHLVGHVYGDEIRLREFWQDRVDEGEIRELLRGGDR